MGKNLATVHDGNIRETKNAVNFRPCYLKMHSVKIVRLLSQETIFRQINK